MDDIIKSIKAYLYDRYTSPLIGAFIVAWSIWNYRVFLAVFAGKVKATEEIFTQIDKLFSSFDMTIFDCVITINGSFYNGILMPGLLTLSYLYIYPFLAEPVYEHSLEKQKKLREIKQQQEENRLLSVEESREIYKRLADLRAEYSNDIESYNKQITSLNKTIKDLETELLSKSQKTDQLQSTLFDDINDASPEEFDLSIERNVLSLSEGEFQLSDLFTGDQWASLNSTLKQAIGKRFKSKVMRGDFVGVSVSGKGSGNQQIYTKKNKELTAIEENILKLFSGLASNHGQTEPDIQKEIGIHIDTIRLHLHELEEKGYISYMGETDDNEKLYELEPKGRRYLVSNNLLDNEEENS